MKTESRLPDEPVLVGRDNEINQLIQYLDSALRGEGKTVFIGGEAGVGKTRLVNEFLVFAKEKGIQTLYGWCLSEASIPYFPFIEAFNAYTSVLDDVRSNSTVTQQLGIRGWLKGPTPSSDASRLKQHLGISGWLRGSKTLSEPKDSQFFSDPRIERDKTFEAVAQIFLQLTEDEPVILFLDDLQWADQLSLAMLHYLSKKCRESRLLIIGTYRSEEVVPENGKLHPLENTMLTLNREGLLTKIELNRLTQKDMPKLLESIFYSSFEKEFVERLYRETEGNPLFAIETLNLLVEEGFITASQGEWRLTIPAETIGIPSKVQGVIIRRISRIERSERDILDLAAVCGQSFDANLLSRTLSMDLIDVLKELIKIEQRHKLIRSIDSIFEFTHQKIREVIYEDLQVTLKRAYHQKTASCLEEFMPETISDSYLADIAHHYVEGEAYEKAFKYLIELGEKAVDIFANNQAIEYLNKALEATQKIPSLATNENLFKIYKNRGRAWRPHEERPLKHTKNDFNLMLQNAIATGDESMIAEAHFWFSFIYNPYFLSENEREERLRHLTTALEIARKTGNKLLEGSSLHGIGMTFFTKIDTKDESLAWFDEASKISRETGNKVIEGFSTRMPGVYYMHRGEYNRAKEYLNRSIALFEEAEDIHLVDPLFYLSIVLTGLGEYNDAISTGQRCLKLSHKYGVWWVELWILNTLGWIYHQLSNIELAKKYNTKSIEFARERKVRLASGGVPYALSNLGMDYLVEKDYENAEKFLEEAWSVRHQHPGEGVRLEPRLFLGKGEVSLAKGDHAQALKNAEESLARSEKAGFKKYSAKGLKLKAEALAEMGNMDEAVELMEKALNLTKEIGTPHMIWQIHHSLGLLLEKHGEPQKAHEHHTKAINLIETTASKLSDQSLANTLLTSPQTEAIRKSCTKTA